MLKANAAFSGLSVNDTHKAKQFYSEVLGLDLVSEEMGLKYKLPGGGTLFIYGKEDHEPASFTVINFVVEDIDAAVDELASQRVVFKHYPNMPGELDEKGILRGRSSNMGPDIAWFKDPASNILSIIQE